MELLIIMLLYLSIKSNQMRAPFINITHVIMCIVQECLTGMSSITSYILNIDDNKPISNSTPLGKQF